MNALAFRRRSLMLDDAGRPSMAVLSPGPHDSVVASATGHDTSMRILEVLAAGIALVAALLLSLVH